MHRTETIKENRDFARLYRTGRSVASDCLVLYYRKNRFPWNRLGITVSKKVGKAVVRNRVRRRIKEAYRELAPKIQPGYDLVIVARVRAAESSYQKIKGALSYLLHQGKLKNYEVDSN